MPVTRQQRVFYKTFSQHGSGTAMVEIEPKDVVLLIHIAYLDIFENEPDWFSEPFYQLAKESFYTITPEKVAELPGMTVEDAINYLQLSGATNTENVIYLYLKNLSTSFTALGSANTATRSYASIFVSPTAMK